MRNFVSCLLITLLTLSLAANEVYAKRFGGGRSFGVQRSHSAMYSPKQHSTTSASPQRSNTSKWGGMLGGLLVGGLLASLFMGHGFGAGILAWLFVGVIALIIIGFWRQRMQPGFQTAQAGNYKPFYAQQASNVYSGNTASEQPSMASTYPAGFSPEDFLRESKVKFIRLQAAFDNSNLEDLRDFTAPEVFAEIKMQLEERGGTPNKTEVLQLNAELLDVSRQVDSNIASVRFTGTIKEEDNAAESFDEIWHFRQFSPQGEWVVGGIQQE